MDNENSQMRGVKPYQFTKGQSGNPAGRPKGSKNRMKALAEGLIGDKAKLIVKKVIEMALAGNEACLRMCMDRILPAQRAVDSAKDGDKQAINIFVGETQKVAIQAKANKPIVIEQEEKEIIDVNT